MAEFKEISPNASAGAKLANWFDNRFPSAGGFYRDHMSQYYAPKNFNFWYFFGSLALLVLVIQIVTGIFLVMHYKPDANLAFASVEYIMRDVPWGWLIRYMHSTGASAFFVVVYLHMFKALMYGSYRKPRELVWIFGCTIFLMLMAEAFFGYLLPWGQMSYWGAQVIVNLFAAVPFVGPDNRAGAKLVGDALAKTLKSGDKVGIIEGVPTTTNAQQRTAGFKDAMEAARMKVVSVQSGNWEIDKGNAVAAIKMADLSANDIEAAASAIEPGVAHALSRLDGGAVQRDLQRADLSDCARVRDPVGRRDAGPGDPASPSRRHARPSTAW